jgi:hypothetical protein
LDGLPSMPQMPIPQDWDGVEWGCFIVQWPASIQWQAILLGFVTTPSVGRFWDASTGIIIDAQDIGKEIVTLNDCLWGVSPMGCLEDIVTAINNLGGVINNVSMGSGSCCSSGLGGSGVYEEDPSSFVDSGDNFPSGYDDRADYLASKCKLAAYVINRWANTISSVRAINASSQTAEGVAILLAGLAVVPTPFSLVLGIASSILALYAIGASIYESALEEAQDWMEGLDICLLYNAESAEQAKSNVLSDLESQSFTQDTLVKSIVSGFITYDVTNILFDAKPAINIDLLPAADCSSCADECAIVESNISFSGTFISWTQDGDDATIRLQSVGSGGFQSISVYNSAVLSENFGCCMNYTLTPVSGYVNPGTPNFGYYYDCETGTLHDSVDTFAELEGCHTIVGVRGLGSSTFVMDVHLTAVGC